MVLFVESLRPVAETLLGKLKVIFARGGRETIEIPPIRIGPPNYDQANALPGTKSQRPARLEQTPLVAGVNDSHSFHDSTDYGLAGLLRGLRSSSALQALHH